MPLPLLPLAGLAIGAGLLWYFSGSKGFGTREPTAADSDPTLARFMAAGVPPQAKGLTVAYALNAAGYNAAASGGLEAMARAQVEMRPLVAAGDLGFAENSDQMPPFDHAVVVSTSGAEIGIKQKGPFLLYHFDLLGQPPDAMVLPGIYVATGGVLEFSFPGPFDGIPVGAWWD